MCSDYTSVPVISCYMITSELFWVLNCLSINFVCWGSSIIIELSSDHHIYDLYDNLESGYLHIVHVLMHQQLPANSYYYWRRNVYYYYPQNPLRCAKAIITIESMVLIFVYPRLTSVFSTQNMLNIMWWDLRATLTQNTASSPYHTGLNSDIYG